MIGGRRPIKGRKPADRRVRVERPHSAYFRYTGPGQLVAKPAASVPRSGLGRTPCAHWKAWLLGRPLANEEEIGERLLEALALPIFSSDAISSSAYATEEILRVLVLGGRRGPAHLDRGRDRDHGPARRGRDLVPPGLPTPSRAGAAPTPWRARSCDRSSGLVAAAALLIDYVMTVAVSTSSAIDQLISVLPGLYDLLGSRSAVVVIALITVANLRGLRESGNIFAVPTYLFVSMALVIVASGLFHIVTGTATPMPHQPEAVGLGTQSIGIFLILRAFASGSVALTGVEAIANGVPAFKPPESRNAGNTMIAMAILLGTIFIGVTIIARAYDIVPSLELSGGPTVIALVAQTAFGAGSPLFYLFQVATALILFLAANTSFNAFPRLAAILAEDGYIPRQFCVPGRPPRVQLGDRPAGRDRGRAATSPSGAIRPA